MFKENSIDNLKVENNVMLDNRVIQLRAESAGYKDGDYAFLYKDKDWKLESILDDVSRTDLLLGSDF